MRRPAHLLAFYGLYGVGILVCLLLLQPSLGPYLNPWWIIVVSASLPMMALATGCTLLMAARGQQQPGTPAEEQSLPVKVAFHVLGLAFAMAIVVSGWLWFVHNQSARILTNLPAPTAASGAALDTLSAADLSWHCTSVTGERLVLGELAEEEAIVFYNVWATWCRPCVAEMPSIAALREALPEGRVRFLLVSTEDLQEVREFAAEQGLGLPFASASSLPVTLRTRGIPATFVLQGARVLYRHVGGANWNDPAFREWLVSICR